MYNTTNNNVFHIFAWGVAHLTNRRSFCRKGGAEIEGARRMTHERREGKRWRAAAEVTLSQLQTYSEECALVFVTVKLGLGRKPV